MAVVKSSPSPVSTLAIYLRTAVGGDAHAEQALADQHQRCTARLASLGLEPFAAAVRTYSDAGASGINHNRPGLVELLADVKSGQLSVVVVSDLQRLSRNTVDLVKILDDLSEAGVRVIDCTTGFDLGQDVGQGWQRFKVLMTELIAIFIPDPTPDPGR